MTAAKSNAVLGYVVEKMTNVVQAEYAAVVSVAPMAGAVPTGAVITAPTAAGIRVVRDRKIAVTAAAAMRQNLVVVIRFVVRQTNAVVGHVVIETRRRSAATN